MHYEAQPMGENPEEGKVMLCTATDCLWNSSTKCIADVGVMINFHTDHADCNTYTRNKHFPGESGAAEI